MESTRKSKLEIELSFLPSLKSAAESIWCPACQSDQVRRARTGGIAEPFLAKLLIRPYRCEECDFRFFRWSTRHKPKATRPARRSNARDSNVLATREASADGRAAHACMG